MSWTELSGGNVLDIKKSLNEAHCGTYKGKKEITTKIGPQVVWNFESEEGDFGIYGFTNLNRVMETVKEGQGLRITYTGTKNCMTKFGMKNVHQVKVERWDGEETIPAGEVTFP